jgi:hypothetical protein
MRLGRIPPERLGPVLAFDRLKLGGGVAFVMMVQPTDFANFDHLTFGGRLSSSKLLASLPSDRCVRQLW